MHIQIYQIFYNLEHKSKLDPAFSYYDNSGIRNELLEFAVFEKISVPSKSKKLDFWGAVSWKFKEKTNLEGKQFTDYIASRPQYDVFYMNPSPINEALFDNGWLQGEISHPRLIELTAKIFNCADLPVELIYKPAHSQHFSTANYFVGNHKFWSLYIRFVNDVLKCAEKKLHLKYKKLLHANADPKNLHHGATFIPFIIERLFSTFMMLYANDLQFHKIRLLHLERQLDPHLQGLRMMKDQALETNSEWLFRAWRNYRNLYLAGFTKPEWQKDFLPIMNSESWVKKSHFLGSQDKVCD